MAGMEIKKNFEGIHVFPGNQVNIHALSINLGQ